MGVHATLVRRKAAVMSAWRLFGVAGLIVRLGGVVFFDGFCRTCSAVFVGSFFWLYILSDLS